MPEITDIEDEEEDENFGLCERFVVSNLLYHKCLDPEEGRVLRQLAAIREKFLIHAQPDKAQPVHRLSSLNIRRGLSLTKN